MSDLTSKEKRWLESYFEMNGGWFLDFSNASLEEFISEYFNIEIYSETYNHGSGSKANRIRAFWEVQSNQVVGRFIKEVIEFDDDECLAKPYCTKRNQELKTKCLETANRLQNTLSGPVPQPIPIQAQPTAPVQGQPSAPMQAQPTAPMQGQPSAPVQAQPTAPMQGRPSAPVQGQHTAPIQAQPTAPVQGQPSAPMQAQPTAPMQGQPSAPMQGQPSAPVQAQPTAPVQGQPSAPMQAQPTAPMQGQPSAPVQGKPSRSDPVSPHMRALIQQAQLASLLPEPQTSVQVTTAGTYSGDPEYLRVPPRPIKNKVFIVHGHDELPKEKVARFIGQLGLEPIILHEQASSSNTIIEKIESYAEQVCYAVVLYTPCDHGAISNHKKLKSRARQNVVFEHGYFIAKLGRKNVTAMVKGDVELPNDFSGVVYVNFDGSGAWKFALAQDMKKSGCQIDMNRVI